MFECCLSLNNSLAPQQGHIQTQRFAPVSGLNDMFPGNGVHRGLRYVFSCLVVVSKNVSPISSNVYINHTALKRQLAQWVQVKSFNMCPLQLGLSKYHVVIAMSSGPYPFLRKVC